jgi:hypothetical protein
VKFKLRGENQNPDVGHVGVYAALAGIRCDEIALEQCDVANMYHMLASGSEVQRAKLQELLGNWLCKFVPPGR